MGVSWVILGLLFWADALFSITSWVLRRNLRFFRFRSGVEGAGAVFERRIFVESVIWQQFSGAKGRRRGKLEGSGLFCLGWGVVTAVEIGVRGWEELGLS